MTASLPRRPVFRPGVALHMEPREVDLTYRGGGCLIELDEATADQARDLLSALRLGGSTREELKSQYRDLEVETILGQLDAQGLLTDSPGAAPSGFTGGQAYRRARRRYLTTMAKAGEFYPRQLSERLFQGTAAQTELIGYAIEYYHVVAHCPRVLAPALAQADDHKSMMMLREFYQSEMNHDRMLIRSLSTLGIDPVKSALLPLPSTFAMMSSLGVLAATFPLGLKAALFVLEEPQPEFNESFVKNCKRLDLPDAFIAPIAQHSDVNEGESHDDISADLFDRIEYVSPEEMQEIEKAVSDMAEQLAAAGQEITDWYGAERRLRLRTP
ncbi:iron-containing redox enzyme family protein [Pseudonocardia alni]|uniref:iron-containing redox enzyme family protein n=1 Tax=Pseudonocardia alni TaxID=33907 RepID=UPI00280A60AF|nr:iron-containing redox enzyme family protein [Pseudonocardia alni]